MELLSKSKLTGANRHSSSTLKLWAISNRPCINVARRVWTNPLRLNWPTNYKMITMRLYRPSSWASLRTTPFLKSPRIKQRSRRSRRRALTLTIRSPKAASAVQTTRLFVTLKSASIASRKNKAIKKSSTIHCRSCLKRWRTWWARPRRSWMWSWRKLSRTIWVTYKRCIATCPRCMLTYSLPSRKSRKWTMMKINNLLQT